jgi:alginate O-acetyltransferase complex protein AlgI
MLSGAVALGHMLPGWAFMWIMLFAIVAGCKWLTLCRAVGLYNHVHVWRFAAYVFAWPGMDSRRFLNPGATPIRPMLSEWLQALAKLTLGAALIWVGARLASDQWFLAGWIGLIGLAFSLHFGLFHGLALAWRSCGVAAQHIFRAPVCAHSVGDLWGSRWNLAFRDLAHQFVFQPLVARTGVLGASFVTFLVSGLVHELVISFPAAAGYGLPTLYFLLQWLGVVAERSPAGQRLGLRRGFVGRLFTTVVVVGPICLLFHMPFMIGVLIPFLKVIGAC